MKHIVSFSGGKDSTAMLLMMIEKGMQIDEIVFCDTKLEFPEMYEYIDMIENHIGRKITRISSEYDWDYYFYYKVQSGKRKGQIYGFPYTLGAWCNSRLKIMPIDKYFNSLGQHIRYIGIAFDEPNRYKRLKANEVALLYDWKVTEQEALEYLKDRNLLNPLYEKFSRLGCWCCPKQNQKSLRVLRKEYPDLWERLLQYDIDSIVSFKEKYTVHELDTKFMLEEQQCSLFDLVI